jgi:hypothetical protein
MVTTKKKAQTGTEVVDWEEEMRRQAQVASEQQRSSGGGGKFFSLKAGVLTFDDQPMPGNQMAVVILADLMENSWYDGEYDPSTPASPKCFAFGHDEADMEPHEAVDNDPYFDRQHPQCSGCPHAEWGSASRGKGKACKNVMRLALIPAGQYKPNGKGRNAQLEFEPYDDPEHYKKAEVAFLKVPVTSVSLYSKYVKQLNADLSRPPHGVVTMIYIEPHPKYQFQVKFELMDKVDAELLPIIMPRHKAELASLDFPYQPPQDDDDKPAGKTTSNIKLRGGKGAKTRGK